MPAGTGGRFEEWLSYLAEEQLHFAEDYALEAQALLARVTRVLREVLGERQLDVLARPAPEWFEELLTILHVQRAVVLTLNYDNFVECGLEAFQIHASYGAGYVGEEDVLDGLPPPIVRPSDFDEGLRGFLEMPEPSSSRPGIDTFQLLKLHGSLSWYWSPGDLTGLSIQRWRLPGAFGNLVIPDEGERNRALFGREPYVVPPAAVKSTYLRSPLIRELWRRADRALRDASRVVLIGYSVPLVDQSFSGMVSDALRGRNVPVEVVDLRPSPVVARLRRLGVRHVRSDGGGGEHAVEKWVGAERDRLAEGVLPRLLAVGLKGDELMFLDLRDSTGVVAVRPSQSGEEAVVTPNPPGPVPRPATTAELLNVASGARRLVAECGDRMIPILDFSIHRQQVPFRSMLDQVRFVTARG
ncbi:MAG: hypothetical protein ABSA65_17045 [Acidimicrobiales bacterium]